MADVPLPTAGEGEGARSDASPLAEIDFDLAGRDVLGQGPTWLGRRGTGERSVGAVRVLKPFGRFGNNYYQAMHALLIASELGIGSVSLPRFAGADAFGHDRALGVSVSFHEAEVDGAEPMVRADDLCGAFYAPFGFEGLFNRLPARHLAGFLRLATDSLYRSVAGASEAADTLAVHFRAGDIFVDGPTTPNWYVQPPASYYVKAIGHAFARRAYGACDLIYEDRGNPALSIVEDHLTRSGIPFSSKPGTLLDDVRRLTSASGIVCSFSSFVEAAILISREVRDVYAFRSLVSQIDFAPFLQTRIPDICLERGIRAFIVEDMSVNYIAPKTWNNSEGQRALMASYPESNLRLFPLMRHPR